MTTTRRVLFVLAAVAMGAAGLTGPVAAQSAPDPVAECSLVERPDGTFVVYWTDSAGATDYVIRRQINGAGPWHHRGKVSQDGYVNGPVPNAGDTAVYAVEAKTGNSAPSARTTCTTVPAPIDPATLAITQRSTDNAVVVTFDQSIDAKGYNIHRLNPDGSVTYLGPWRNANDHGPTVTVVDRSPLQVGQRYTYSVQSTAGGDVRSARIDRNDGGTIIADVVGSGERYGTARIDGRWEIVETAEPEVPARWEAINVRGDQLDQNPLDQTDIDNIAERFNTIRLVVHWDDIQPTEAADVAQNLDQQILDLIVMADNATTNGQPKELGIILDPIHLGGEDGFRVPEWAWIEAPVGASRDPNDSFEVLSHRPLGPSSPTLGGAYLAEVLTWVGAHEAAGTFDNVVALELVNEPHPPDGFAYENTDLIAALQAEWVTDLRRIDPDKPMVLTGYFGGALAKRSDVVAEFIEDDQPRFPNLIWTFHNYYTGLPGGEAWDANGDGFGDSDYHEAWKRGSKTGVRVERWGSEGCYGLPSAPPNGKNEEYACPEPSWSDRIAMRGHLIDSITIQDDLAQGAGMPLFVGEWGVPRYRLINGDDWVGWGHAQRLVCDHLIAMRSLGHPGHDAVTNSDLDFHRVSYAAWNFDRRGDAFGFYDGSTGRWFDDTTGEPSPGRTQNLTGQGTARPFITDFCTG